MDVDNGTKVSADAQVLSRKSWVAYLGPVLLAVIALGVAVPTLLTALQSPVAAGIAVLLVLSVLIYKLMVIRSFKLYIDAVGVWVYRGVLPWNKGVAGVKWRDLDEALFNRGILAWAFKSYTVRIGHRFTKASEIVLSAMFRGDKAAMEINGRHQAMIRARDVE